MNRSAGSDVAGSPGLRTLVRGATDLLTEAGVPSPDVDARALAAHVLGVARLDLVTDDPVPGDFPAAYAAVVDRRRRRQPLQHIVGHQAFRYLELVVEPGVFVPRPETEVVAQVAVDAARQIVARTGTALVVDLCCGTGAIAASVANEVPGAVVHAVDVSAQAVALTARNAHAAGAVVHAVVGDVADDGVLADLAGQVDVVVANPPYIPPDAEPTEPEVRDHDPDHALYGGGPDGLEVPRAVLRAAVRLLRDGGTLVCEHAEVQAVALREAAVATGALGDVGTQRDLSGRDRMVVARRLPREAGPEPSGPAPRFARPGVEDSPS